MVDKKGKRLAHCVLSTRSILLTNFSNNCIFFDKCGCKESRSKQQEQQQQRHFLLRYQILISNYGCALKFSIKDSMFSKVIAMRYQILISNYGCALKFPIKDSMFSKVIAIFYLKRRYFHTRNIFVYLCLL